MESPLQNLISTIYCTNMLNTNGKRMEPEGSRARERVIEREGRASKASESADNGTQPMAKCGHKSQAINKAFGLAVT